jgi:hypothetical protein
MINTSRHFSDPRRYDAPDYLDTEDDLRIADAENRQLIDAERADDILQARRDK